MERGYLGPYSQVISNLERPSLRDIVAHIMWNACRFMPQTRGIRSIQFDLVERQMCLQCQQDISNDDVNFRVMPFLHLQTHVSVQEISVWHYSSFSYIPTRPVQHLGTFQPTGCSRALTGTWYRWMSVDATVRVNTYTLKPQPDSGLCFSHRLLLRGGLQTNTLLRET